GKWRSVKWRGLVAKLAKHLADDQIIALARLGDAKLPNRSHRQIIKRAHIAYERPAIPGLLDGAIGPGTFTSARIILGGNFFRPFERSPYNLASLSPVRAQLTATVDCEGRLLGWGLRRCDQDRREAQHRSSRICEPPELEHVATLLVTFPYVNRPPESFAIH